MIILCKWKEKIWIDPWKHWNSERFFNYSSSLQSVVLIFITFAAKGAFTNTFLLIASSFYFCKLHLLPKWTQRMRKRFPAPQVLSGKFTTIKDPINGGLIVVERKQHIRPWGKYAIYWCKNIYICIFPKSFQRF